MGNISEDVHLSVTPSCYTNIIHVFLAVDLKQEVLHIMSILLYDNFTREFSFHPEHQDKSMTDTRTSVNTDFN